MKNTKNILFVILIVTFVINTKAQDKIILENDRIEDVIDSDKPYIKIPYQEVSEDDLPKINFESQDLYVESDFDPEPPAPKVLEQKPKEPLKNNFLKIGIGNFVTPSVLLSAHNGRSTGLDYGLDFDHLSSHSDPVEYRNFRRDEGRLSLGYALNDDKKVIGSLSIYNTSYFNYADTARTRRGTLQKYEDTIRMNFTQINLAGNLRRIYKKENQLAYDLGLKLNSYSDRRDNSLFILGLVPRARWAFDEQLSINLESEFHFENGTIGGLTSSGIFVKVNPILVYQSKDLQLSGGIKWSAANRQGEVQNRSFIAPMAELRYRLMPHEMTVFAGVTGDLKDQHYSDLIRINPYLASDVEPDPTIEKLNIYGGVSGQIPGLLDYNVKVSYRTVENAIVFTIPEDGAFFNVENDSLMTDLGIKLEVNYDLLKSVKIGASVESHSYKMSTLAKNFHAPPLTLKAFAQYKATDKLMIKSSLNLFGSTPMTLDTAEAVINRAVYIDLNAGVDYRVNDVFSAWIQVNNLLGTNYQRWWNYKERSIEVRGGISLAF